MGGGSSARLPVLLPPGGLDRFTELAMVVSERPGFFDDAFEVREYDPAERVEIGSLAIGFVPGRHYVPAWGVSIVGPVHERLVYAGDTGPNPDLVEAARGANLLVCEATLADDHDDNPANRGHLSLEETLEHASSADVTRLIVTHFPSRRRAAMVERIAGLGGWAALARPGLTLEVSGDGRRPASGADGSSGIRGPRPSGALPIGGSLAAARRV